MTANTQLPPARKFESFAKLAEAAEGRWPEIFSKLASELDLAQENAPHHVPCPVHGGVDGFRLFTDYPITGGGWCNTCGAKSTGFTMLIWLKGYSIKEAAKEVNDFLCGSEVTERPIERLVQGPPQKTPEDFAKVRKFLRKTWEETSQIKGTVAAAYLGKRGIPAVSIPESLRVHRGLQYVHGPKKEKLGYFPCMVAPIRRISNEIVALHRTFITKTGEKAPVPSPKKMTSSCGELIGASIHLFPVPGEVLGVTEGIETALAVHSVTLMPVWAGVTAVLMEQMEVPDSVKLVVIWADKDRSERGMQAAEKLAKRLEEKGIRVEVYFPPVDIPEGSKGVDWLDMLNKHGIFGFPAKWRKVRTPLAA